MPLYEYVCRACAHAFEELVRGGERPHCPACRSEALDRVLSVVSIGSDRPRADAPVAACGTCGDPRGPGSCARD